MAINKVVLKYPYISYISTYTWILFADHKKKNIKPKIIELGI